MLKGRSLTARLGRLSCPSVQGLRQHLLASHEYFEYGFSEDGADAEPEIAIRCRRGAWQEVGRALVGWWSGVGV